MGSERLKKPLDESLTQDKLRTIFDGLEDDWERKRERSGHLTYRNKLTGIVLGCSGHKADGTLDDPEIRSLFMEIQTHLNRLSNYTFKGRWWDRARNPCVPDYTQALKDFKEWDRKRREIARPGYEPKTAEEKKEKDEMDKVYLLCDAKRYRGGK